MTSLNRYRKKPENPPEELRKLRQVFRNFSTSLGFTDEELKKLTAMDMVDVVECRRYLEATGEITFFEMRDDNSRAYKRTGTKET